MKAFRDSDLGYEPFGEKIGFRKVGQPGVYRTLGAIFTSFKIFAGKGDSEYGFYGGSDEFESLSDSMIEANGDAAIMAFGATLQKHDDPMIKALGVVLSGLRKSSSAIAAPVPKIAPAPALAPTARPLVPFPGLMGQRQ